MWDNVTRGIYLPPSARRQGGTARSKQRQARGHSMQAGDRFSAGARLFPSSEEEDEVSGGSEAEDARSRRRSRHRSRHSRIRSASSSDSSPSQDRLRRSVDRGHTPPARHSASTFRRRRFTSPQRPKLEVFKGEGNWETFIFQFERLAQRCGWDEGESCDRLLDCLGGKALEFVSEQRITSYKHLRKQLTRRFGSREQPISARRQLQYVRQKEGESLEEFSQRVHFLAMDGYPGARETTIHQMAIEAFLRGCRDKDAARVAMDKEPRDVYKALKYVKTAVQNNRALFGTGTRPAVRQVSFADDDMPVTKLPPKTEGLEVGTLNVEQLAVDLRVLSEIVHRLSRNRSPARSPSSSPVRSKIRCFRCNGLGHIASRCPTNSTTPPSTPPRPRWEGSPAPEVRAPLNC